MPINPNIAMGVKGIELENPLNQFARFAQIQGAQRENALAQMKMDEYNRSLEEQNRLRAYLEGSDVTTPEGRKGLIKFGKAGVELGKGLLEQEKEAALGKKAGVDLVDAKLKQSRAFLDTIDPNDPNAANQYIAWHEANHKDPILGPELAARGVTAEQARSQIMQKLNQPGGLATLINQSKLGSEKFMEMNKAQLSTTDLNGQVVSRAFKPLTGELTTISTEQKTMAPGEEARLANDATRIALERQRVGLESQRVGLEGRRVAVSESEAQRKATGTEGIPPKELQRRESVYPQATASVKSFEAKADSFVKDLEALKNHPGLSNITGVIAGRTPSLTREGRAAQALYDKIVAKGGFQALQDLRAASVTGGALGNVSNQEGKQLVASFAAIDQRQDAADVRNAIDGAIADVTGAKSRMREAYDMTYDYKQGKATDPLGIR